MNLHEVLHDQLKWRLSKKQKPSRMLLCNMRESTPNLPKRLNYEFSAIFSVPVTMAEWSKAFDSSVKAFPLVHVSRALSTSNISGCVGSNPTCDSVFLVHFGSILLKIRLRVQKFNLIY